MRQKPSARVQNFLTNQIKVKNSKSEEGKCRIGSVFKLSLYAASLENRMVHNNKIMYGIMVMVMKG